MRTQIFAQRNMKEVLRDPQNLFFGLGFPLVLLVLLSVIDRSIPAEAQNTMFAIENLVPGLAMFGTSFMALFAGMLIAKDRSSSFLLRLFASPMSATNYILGYTLPMILVAAGQVTITVFASLAFGFEISVTALPAILLATLNSLLFISIGLLLGSLLNDKAVGGVCGALMTNLAGWFSGMFIPLDLIGGGFKTAAEIMPFYHAVQGTSQIFAGNYSDALGHIANVAGYTLIIMVLAIVVFHKKMRAGNV